MCSFILCYANANINLFNTFIQLMMDFASTHSWCKKWNFIRFGKEMNNMVIDVYYYHNFTW